MDLKQLKEILESFSGQDCFDKIVHTVTFWDASYTYKEKKDKLDELKGLMKLFETKQKDIPNFEVAKWTLIDFCSKKLGKFDIDCPF